MSQSFHYTDHVSIVVTATTTVDFSKVDLSYLEADVRYFFSRISNATHLKYFNFLRLRGPGTDVIVSYPPGRLNSVEKTNWHYDVRPQWRPKYHLSRSLYHPLEGTLSIHFR